MRAVALIFRPTMVVSPINTRHKSKVMPIPIRRAMMTGRMGLKMTIAQSRQGNGCRRTRKLCPWSKHWAPSTGSCVRMAGKRAFAKLPGGQHFRPRRRRQGPEAFQPQFRPIGQDHDPPGINDNTERLLRKQFFAFFDGLLDDCNRDDIPLIIPEPGNWSNRRVPWRLPPGPNTGPVSLALASWK